MENKFNFTSQICTTKEQSERLIALGLKKETADMMYKGKLLGEIARVMPHDTEMSYFKLWDSITPAWSLGRLIEMLPSPIEISEDLPTYIHYAYLNLSKVSVDYSWEDYDGEDRILIEFYGDGFFSAVVDATEWLIKEGYFNKEYLI